MKTLIALAMCLLVAESAVLNRERRFANGVGVVIKKNNFAPLRPPTAAIPMAAVPVPPFARGSIEPVMSPVFPAARATAVFSPAPNPMFPIGASPLVPRLANPFVPALTPGVSVSSTSLKMGVV